MCRELDSTTEEYRLLEQMNRLTATKYTDMRQITTNIAKVFPCRLIATKFKS
jgi:hypothetical protein